MSDRPLNDKPPTQNRTETATRWERWLKDIERQFCYFGITEPETNKDGLIIYGGQTIADLQNPLPDLNGDEAGQDVYAQLINKLNKWQQVKNYREQSQRTESQAREITCNRCGYDRVHKQCPVMGCICNACGKGNHYAKECRPKPKNSGERRAMGTRWATTKQRQWEYKLKYKKVGVLPIRIV